jgi:hypothetical protein
MTLTYGSHMSVVEGSEGRCRQGHNRDFVRRRLCAGFFIPTGQPNRRGLVLVYHTGSTGNCSKPDEIKFQIKIRSQLVWPGIPTGSTGIPVRFDQFPVV